MISVISYRGILLLFWTKCHDLCCLYMMTSSNGNNFRVTGHLCGEFTGSGDFPAQKPVTRSFDVFFDLRLNKRLSKQSWGWWFETLSCPLWRHCYVNRLNHWGRVTPVCFGNLTAISSDNGLSPARRQAIVWSNAGILLIGPLGTNLSQENAFECVGEMTVISSRTQCVKQTWHLHIALIILPNDESHNITQLGPLLLMWFDFNPSMDK